MKKAFYVCVLLFYCNGLFSQNEIPTIKDINYCNDTLNKHLLDIYMPEKQAKQHPCIIWIHGGGWANGHKAEDGGVIDHLELLLKNGYILVSINYRLSSDSLFPACVYDCKAAIRFIKANATKYNIDSSKIGLVGPSAGGHLSALVGTSGGVKELENLNLGKSNVSSRVHAVIDMFGPTDFFAMLNGLSDSCTNPLNHLKPNSPETKLLGCVMTDCPELVKQANPITYITQDDPPFLIVHGSFDCLVSPNCSKLLNEELKKKNVQSELIILEHAKHGGKEFKTLQMQQKYLDFFNKAFKIK